MESYQDLENAIKDFVIPEISEETNFWMVRTQGGFFYKEYIREKFIALGWNVVDSKTVFNDTNQELLKEKIRQIYGNKRPAEGIHKSKRFMNQMKVGDYVLIPNEGSSEIAICKIGEYYEKEISYKDEINTIQRIKSKESIIGEVTCPYKKRRSIEVLMTVSNKRIGYKLLRAISSYHGLSDMNEYAVDILNCVYDCYVYRDDMYIPINIAKRTPVTARELSGLMYGVTNLFSELMVDDKNILATANINSPGKYVVCLKNVYKYIKKGGVPLIVISIFLFGGEFAGNTMVGAVPGTMDTITKWETRNIEKEKRQEELKAVKLDNYLKAIEAIEKTEELGQDIDTDRLVNNIGLILEAEETLELKSNKEFSQVQDGVELETDEEDVEE